MKTKDQVRRMLEQLEQEMQEQAARCQEHGYHSVHSLKWDFRCVRRATLREVLGMRPKAFNEADTMAGW